MFSITLVHCKEGEAFQHWRRDIQDLLHTAEEEEEAFNIGA